MRILNCNNAVKNNSKKGGDYLKRKILKYLTIASTILLVPLSTNFATEAFSPGSITVGNQEINISSGGYVGYGQFAHQAQAVIDTGAVASGVYQLDLNDGLNTHLMAHNPGTFTPIADTIHEGAKYIITDHNGVSKVYEFSYVGEIQAFTPVTGAIEQAIWGHNGETVTLQYCAYGTNIPQIWIGRVSADQSLLNSVKEDAPKTETNTEEKEKVPATVNGENKKSEDKKVKVVQIASKTENTIKWGTKKF